MEKVRLRHVVEGAATGIVKAALGGSDHRERKRVGEFDDKRLPAGMETVRLRHRQKALCGLRAKSPACKRLDDGIAASVSGLDAIFDHSPRVVVTMAENSFAGLDHAIPSGDDRIASVFGD